MNYKLRTIGALMFLFMGFYVDAQNQPKVLTLKDCIQLSLTNHPSSIVANNELEIAKKREAEAISNYLPQVAATGTLDDNIKRQTTIIPAGAFSPTDIKVQFGVQYMTNVFAQVDQAIYDQALIHGIKAAKPNMEIARLQKNKNDDAIIYNTANAYYSCLIQVERLKLLEQNEKKLAEILSIQKQQFERGLIKQVDYERVKVNYNITKSQQDVARLNYKLALNQLKNAMGMSLNDSLVINDSLDFTKIIAEAETPSTGDVKNTWDYKIQNQNLLLQEIDLKRKRASVLPTLNAYGRYGVLAMNNSFGEQYNNLFDYSVVGLRLNVPIFSSFKRFSQIKQSELSLYSARENFKITTNNLELAVMNSNTALASSYTNFLSNKENLELAKSVFDNTTLQYQKGVASLSDMLNAEYSFKEAQTNYINSLVNYLVSRMDLERAKGSLSNYINQL